MYMQKNIYLGITKKIPVFNFHQGYISDSGFTNLKGVMYTGILAFGTRNLIKGKNMNHIIMKRKVTKLLTYFWFNPNCLFVVNLDTYGETATIFLILNTSKCSEPEALKCAKHVKRN